MTVQVGWRRLRAFLGALALLVSAWASIATPACFDADSAQVIRKESFSAGEVVRRFRAFAPRASSISLTVDAEFTLRWPDLPADYVDAGLPYASLSSNSIRVECVRGPCGTTSCRANCEEFVIEVERSDATTSQDFTLVVESSVDNHCSSDPPIVELRVVPE